MCLPCFPWTWTQYDDPLDSMPEQCFWTHDGNSWVLQRMTLLPQYTRCCRAATPPPPPPFSSRVQHTTRSLVSLFVSQQPLESEKQAPLLPESPAMPEAGADTKSPKTARRLRSGEHIAASSTPRQVHFEEQRRSNDNANSAEGGNEDSGSKGTQPASFPAIGPAPGLAGGQWFTSADPSRSICQPAVFTAPQQQQPSSAFFTNQHPQHPAAYHSVTYIGQHPNPLQQHPVHLAPPIMASYSNAGPPPAGVNFQPPVPDSTFGPIPHVYVPRFDAGGPAVQGGPFQSAQVGLPVSPVQFVPVVAAVAGAEMPATTAATFTVLVPKTYYINGYTYYASALVLLCPGGLCPGGVPFGQQGYLVAPQPGFSPQHIAQQLQQPQPIMVNGQTYYPVQAPSPMAAVAGGQPFSAGGPPIMVQGGMNAAAAFNGSVPIIAGVPTSANPEVSGLGRTPNEEMIRQVEFAYQNKLFEPQDFKPSDDDPSRFYYCREQDGNWTQRSRYTLDRMAVRWYVTDEGWFYAVRLPD
ncbi:Uncharacterized protein TPAR_01919 [Tolypocladium paradoxum]|uniref:Uncharacterized protein n=1 Tax=Tolypocladium paradoxum TaxID=94208 RepID=A0A2S4L640_9HYPO|nr:Uncharacterized protein TPAR_01919 [Tolypocladium paradoxum]